MRRRFIAGNWKLHRTVGEAIALARSVAMNTGRHRTSDPGFVLRTEVAVAPPFTALAAVSEALRDARIAVSAQDVYFQDSGAFTGEVSAPMLRDAGCRYVIVGHSERRQFFGDTNELVAKKAAAAQKHALVPIVCVGETLAEREAGQATSVVVAQIAASLTNVEVSGAKLVIAYEPVWAIGTGRNATPTDAQAMHVAVRNELAKIAGSEAGNIRLLYGGSVKPENASALLCEADIDGALVGGASLDADSFGAIVRAADELGSARGSSPGL